MVAARSGVGVPLSTSTVRSARGGVAGAFHRGFLAESPVSPPEVCLPVAGSIRWLRGGGVLSLPPSSVLAPNATPATTTRPSSTIRITERDDVSRRAGGPDGIRLTGAGVADGRRSGWAGARRPAGVSGAGTSPRPLPLPLPFPVTGAGSDAGSGGGAGSTAV